jgi:hypothetical protein
MSKMVLALRKKCPDNLLKQPEPKIAGYREEVRDRGNLYVQTMFSMKRKFVVARTIGEGDQMNRIMSVRAKARAKLVSRFWRHLGAA